MMRAVVGSDRGRLLCETMLHGVMLAFSIPCLLMYFFTNVFFGGVSGGSFSIVSSISFSAALVALLAVAGAWGAGFGSRSESHTLLIEALSIAIMAVACLIPMGDAGDRSFLEYACTGMLFGLSAGLGLVGMTCELASGVAFRSIGASWAAAIMLFAVSAAAFVPAELLLSCLVMLAVAFAALLARVFVRFRMRIAGECEGDAPSAVRPIAARPRLLAFFSAFLMSLMYNMYPLSTRYAALGKGLAAGSLTADAAGVLGISFLGIVVVARVVGKPRRRAIVSAPAFVAIVAGFGLAFMILPFMRDSSLPFVVLVPFAFVVIVSLLQKAPEGRGLFDLIVLASVGALTAAVLSLLLFELFWGHELQSALFMALPAVSVAAVFALILRSLPSLSFPGSSSGSKPQGDFVPSLEEQCLRLADLCGLTKREGEIVALVARGLNGPSIQEELSLSESTVKTHMRHIYEKCSVTTRQDLIRLIRNQP